MYNKQLKVFIDAAELGSFSKAAQKNYISSTALIQQISLLEENLSIKLFNRTSRGVRLTEAGLSLYEDAKKIISFSNDAVSKAYTISKKMIDTVRIGTSFLTKIRYLNELITKIKNKNPELEIIFISQQLPNTKKFIPLSELGNLYDMFEGIYVSEYYRNKCNFLELKKIPIYPAISKKHKLFKKKKIYFDDLKGEKIVLVKRGISEEFDLLRNSIEKYNDIEIIDVSFYDINVFLNSELNNYILFTPVIWADLHPNLKIHNFEREYFISYGIIFKYNLSLAASKFIATLSSFLKTKFEEY